MGLFHKTEEKKGIYCSECGTINDELTNYCLKCGHKLKTISKNDDIYKRYCDICGKVINKNDKVCGYCGYEVLNIVKKTSICPVCGEWRNYERFCINCGHDRMKDNISGSTKICPNCNKRHPQGLNYCIDCGTKLIKK